MNTARRPTAPDSALTVRTIGSLTVVGSYVVFRLPLVISSWEAVLTWVGALVCGAIAISSIEELGLRRYFRAQRIKTIRQALDEAPTETFAVPLRWPGEVELAIADARHDALQPLIADGEVVEPRLFTHDYDALHHTPARGIPKFVDDDGRVSAVEILQRLTEGGWIPKDTPARHAAAHIARDRFGSLFGAY